MILIIIEVAMAKLLQSSRLSTALLQTALVLSVALFSAAGSAGHGPNFSDDQHAHHTQSVTRTTSEEDIVISIKSKKPSTQSPAGTPAGSGTSNEQIALLKIYRSNLLKKTYQHVVYPDSAIEKNHEGEVILTLTVDRNGRVQQIGFDSRARFNSLNKAASIAVKRAKPYPPVPKRLQGKSFEISMPIRFRLTG